MSLVTHYAGTPTRERSRAGVRCFYFGSLVLQVLEDACGAHAAADAHGDHAVAAVATLHLVHELDGELGAGRAHRVAEGDRAAVDVGLLQVHADLPDHG
jgi:hypothetical protein